MAAVDPLTDTLRNRMTALLLSDAAQRIDFYFDRIHVDGSGLSFVALALLPKPRGQRGLTIRVGRVAPGAGATYDGVHNRFDFPSAAYGTTPGQRQTILHECVHALRDAHGPTLRSANGPVITRALSDEASAYVAGAMFHIFDTGNTTPPPWAVGDVVFGLAHDIAVTMAGQRGLAVPPRDAKALRDAVMNDPLYADLKANPKRRYHDNGLRL